MEQVLIAGIYNLLHITTTEYSVVSGEGFWGTQDFVSGGMISTPGKLKNLRVELNDVPGTGTYTFTLRRRVGTAAFANTALTCTVGSGDTQANDMVNEVAVAAGDIVILECNPASPANARYAKWSMVFEGDTTNESLLIGASGNVNDGVNLFLSPTRQPEQAVENSARCVCPTGGTIKNLFVQLNADPGNSPDAYRFTLRIDGVSKALTVTITANDRTGNDTANDIAVSAGDVLTIMIEPLNTPLAEPWATVGMTFVADTDGESLILGGTNSDLDATTTKYLTLACRSNRAWIATEDQRYQLAQVCVLKKLYMLLSDSPGVGNKYTFTVRRNDTSPASGLVVEITDSATTGNDTGNEVAIVNDDEIDLQSVPTSTPTVRDAYWGLVSFISPGPITQAVGNGAIAIAGTLGLLTKLGVGAGSIAIAGTLSATLTFLQVVGSGAVAIVGSLSAALTFFQSVGAGSVAIAGSLNRLIKLSVGGSIAISGLLNGLFTLAVGGGNIAIAGSLNRKIKIAVGNGAIAIAGVAVFTLDRILAIISNLMSDLTIKSFLGISLETGYPYTYPITYGNDALTIESILSTDLTIKSTLLGG